MLEKYKNIDWLDKNNWNLNNNLHPTRKNTFYGNSINPYEVIFHKWYWKNEPTVNFQIILKYIKTNMKNYFEYPPIMFFNFNYHNYLFNYKDLRKLSYFNAFHHYLNFGIKEGRNSGNPINNKTNITIILHLFNLNLLNEMIDYINQVKRVFYKVTIIITTTDIKNNDKIINNFNLESETKNIHIIPIENKGVDVYAFLISILYIRNNNIPTDFILKLHTKDNKFWKTKFNFTYY